MKIEKNIVINGKHNKPILLDFAYKVTGNAKPVVVFAHGFKGFKDWGHFNKVMEYFKMQYQLKSFIDINYLLIKQRNKTNLRLKYI